MKQQHPLTQFQTGCRIAEKSATFGQWLIGFIEINQDNIRTGGRFRIDFCPDNKRDRETLHALILKHCKPGTIITTDKWRGYLGIDALGYEHFTVNHSENFVDPETGANTQAIESQWKQVKKVFRDGVRKDLMYLHLCEFLWRRYVRMMQTDPFDDFLRICSVVYNPLTYRATGEQRNVPIFQN
ncbi:hypothetical protein B4U80_11300 [Leptotrombidium deliense]|uniref:ISXO2-like transposase domain-containing protein n=1 Tax=Leptotrombidium deliense TaxID=299467 RepID=A0A443S3P7_9ACAR|nr:hypothetical protein B4U80_11300 [Leptotrombidium deliense]